MSRSKRLKARDKITLKNSRDGLIERNATTGEDKRISKRVSDFNLRGEQPERAAPDARASSSAKADRPTYSQLGNSSGKRSKRKQVYRHGKTGSTSETKQSVTHEADKPTTLQFTETQTSQTAQADAAVSVQTADTTPDKTPAANAPQSAFVSNDNHILQKPPSAKSKPPPAKKRYYQQLPDKQSAKPESPDTPKSGAAPVTTASVPIEQPADRSAAALSDTTPPPKSSDGKPKHADRKPDSRLNTENNSRLKFASDEAATAPRGKRKKPKPRVDGTEKTAVTESIKPTEMRKSTDTTKPDSDNVPKSAEQTTERPAQYEPAPPKNPASDTSALKPDKSTKLQFTPDEATPDTPKIHHNRKLGKAQNQADRAVTKLEKAQSKLPKKRKLRSKRVFDEEKGKAKRKLYFESEVKPQGQHLKGALPLRPVKAVGNSTLAFGHKKMFQVERENVATEAAHKGEMFAEGGIRSALRFHKTAPYNKVEKLERKAAKKSINLTYQKALAENPKLKSNLLSRAFQKRKIKKDYAKAAREAQKAAQQAKKAGSVVTNVGKALISVVKRHPVATAAIVLILLLLFALMSLIGAFGSMGSGGLGGILTASYLADDADIDNAELAYTEWETDLQFQIANAESTHAG